MESETSTYSGAAGFFNPSPTLTTYSGAAGFSTIPRDGKTYSGAAGFLISRKHTAELQVSQPSVETKK